MKVFRNPDVMWREETDMKEKAYQGLEEMRAGDRACQDTMCAGGGMAPAIVIERV